MIVMRLLMILSHSGPAHVRRLYSPGVQMMLSGIASLHTMFCDCALLHTMLSVFHATLSETRAAPHTEPSSLRAPHTTPSQSAPPQSSLQTMLSARACSPHTMLAACAPQVTPSGHELATNSGRPATMRLLPQMMWRLHAIRSASIVSEAISEPFLAAPTNVAIRTAPS